MRSVLRRPRRRVQRALVVTGPPLKSGDVTYEVVVGERVLARFASSERLNAVDFANGYNLAASSGGRA